MLQELKNIQKVYFVGVGGIGMSALARWFNANGRQVAGYDRTATPLTRQLEQEGIAIHYQDDVKLIPGAFLQNGEDILVVFTPAIPKDHTELNYFRNNGYSIKKRSEVLGILTKGMHAAAVAGTHGKTTTSSMIAHILKYAGADCAAFLGGITQNYQTNLILNKELNENTIVVVEADEFDRSFLRLFPDVAVITSTDADHLDIYGDKDQMLQSYSDFAKQVGKGGTLLVRQGIELPSVMEGLDGVKVHYYGLEQQEQAINSEFTAQNVRIESARFVFDFVQLNGQRIENIWLIMPGFHNVENAVAAAAVALELGIEPEKIREALGTYRGVKRRFEYVFEHKDVVYIDDYAHHPTEIEAFLRSVRALYPNHRLTAIFQPHLFSRTRDFHDGFARSLSLPDTLVLLPIYPARELPMEGVTSKMIFDLVTLEDKYLIEDEDLLNFIRERLSSQNGTPELIVTVGAGDIDTFINPIREILEEKYK